MQHTSILNNGAPLRLPTEPSNTQYNKFDPYYVTAIYHGDNVKSDPLDFHQKIIEELEVKGESIIINEARIKWKNEQETNKRIIIESLLDDPSIDRQTKLAALKEYTYKDTISDDIKDKYIQHVTENTFNLDSSLEDIELSNYNNSLLKEDQNLEKVDDTIVESVAGIERYSEEEAVEHLSSAFERLFDTNGAYSKDFETFIQHAAAEYPTLLYILIGSAPDWINQIYDTLETKAAPVKDKTGKPVMINPLLVGIDIIQQQATKAAGGKPQSILKKVYGELTPNEKAAWTFTKIRQYIAEKNDNTTFTSQFRHKFEELLVAMGFDQDVINNTLVARSFETLGQAIRATATTLSPNDPDKLAIPLELGLGFLGLRSFKKLYNGYKNRRTRQQQEGERRFQNARDVTPGEGDISPNPPIRIESIDPFLPEVPNAPTRPTPPDLAINQNTPITSTLRTDPETGIAIIDDLLNENNSRYYPFVGMTPEKLINILFSERGVATNNPYIGWTTDAARLWELEAFAKKDLQTIVANPTTGSFTENVAFLQEMSHSLNSFETRVPMVPAISYSGYAGMSPLTTATISPVGIETWLAFRRDTTHDFSVREAMAAYRELKEHLEDRNPNEFRPDSPEFSELVLQEISPEGAYTLNQFKSDAELARAWNENKIDYDNFRLIWHKKQPEYSGELRPDQDFGIPSTQFQTNKYTKWFFDSDIKMGGSEFRAPVSEYFFTYGRMQKGLEQLVYTQRMVSDTFAKQQQKMVQQWVYNKLSKRNQKHLRKVSEYAARQGTDYVTYGMIREATNTRISADNMKLIQQAFNIAISHAASMHRVSNIMQQNALLKRGYNEGFYYKEGNELIYMPGKNKFAIKEIKAPFDPYTYEGQQYPAEYWDFSTMEAKEIVVHPNNFGNREQFVYQNGQPTHRLYRLSRNYEDTNANIYQYGAYPLQGASPLPKTLFKRKNGYMGPVIHLDDYVVRAFPKRVKINGNPIDFSALDPLNNTKDYATIVTAMEPYARPIHMSSSKAHVDEWLAWHTGINRNGPLNSDTHLHVVSKVQELKLNNLEEHFELLNSINQYSQQRVQGLDFTLTEDPYVALMRASQSIHRGALDGIALDQLKMSWIKQYVDGKKANVTPNADPVNAEAFGVDNSWNRTDKLFPREVSQIRDVLGMEDYGRQARIEWQKITERSQGLGQEFLTSFLKNTLDIAADLAESKLSKKLAQSIRKKQRHPQDIINILPQMVTTLYITSKSLKQWLIQPIGTAGIHLAVSKGIPTKLASQVWDVVRLSNYVLANYYKRNHNTEMANAYDVLNNYMFKEGNRHSNPAGNFLTYGRKINPEFWIPRMEEYGLLDVSQHYFAQGLGSNLPKGLGQSKGILGRLGRAATLVGFTPTEGLNRIMATIAAIRNFEARYPNLNPEHPSNVNKILYDAYQLTGSMTSATKLGTQKSIVTRIFGQFKSYMANMSSLYIFDNASPLTGRMRLVSVLATAALFGSLPYGTDDPLDEILEEFDPEGDYTGWRKYTGIWQLARILEFDEPLLGPNGEEILSKGDWGRQMSPFGNEFSAPLGLEVLIDMYKTLRDGADSDSLPVVVQIIKNISAAHNHISLLYTEFDDVYTDAEKLQEVGITMVEFFPAVRDVLKTKHNLEVGDIIYPTGAKSGIPATDADIIANGLFQVQRPEDKKLRELMADSKLFQEYVQDLTINTLKLLQKRNPGKQIVLDDFVKVMNNIKLYHQGREYFHGSEQHREFSNLAMKYIVRNNEGLAKQFADSFILQYNESEPNFAVEQIDQAFTLSQLTRDAYPELSDSLKQIGEAMQRRNKIWEDVYGNKGLTLGK